jgi:peptide/nickel transport system substrate-binding protein
MFSARLSRLLGGAAFAVALSAGTAVAQTPGGTLVILTTPEPTILTNAVNSAPTTAEVATKIFDGLLEYDMDLKPIPSLATEWTVSEDGKTITFKLRDDVKFHDGKPLTSADVQFSLMQVVKDYHPRGPGNLGALEAIETPDPQTAVLKLKHPYPPMMKGLSSLEAPILPKHLYEGTDYRNNPNNNKPVGSGPFRFREWNRGSHLTLEKNPIYWRQGRPYLDRVIFRFIADAATRAAAIESGEAHVATFGTISPVEMRRLEKLPHIKIAPGGYEALAPVMLFEINTQKKPFDDKRVRQAMAYAMDRDFITKNIWYGFGGPAVGPISSVFKGAGLYTDEVRRYDVADRVERANALLDEAGLKRNADGTRFEMILDVSPFGEDWRRMGEYVRQAFEKVGIKVTLRNQDYAAMIRQVYTDYNFDMTSAWYVGMADPTLGVQRQYVTSNIKQGVPFNNVTRFSNPEVDRLWAAAAQEMDAKKRGEIFHQIQKITVEESPIIWVMEMQLVAVHNDKVKNLITSPLGVRGGLYETWLQR